MKEDLPSEARQKALTKYLEDKCGLDTFETKALEQLKQQAEEAVLVLLSKGKDLPTPPFEVRDRLKGLLDEGAR